MLTKSCTPPVVTVWFGAGVPARLKHSSAAPDLQSLSWHVLATPWQVQRSPGAPLQTLQSASLVHATVGFDEGHFPPGNSYEQPVAEAWWPGARRLVVFGGGQVLGTVTLTVVKEGRLVREPKV